MKHHFSATIFILISALSGFAVTTFAQDFSYYDKLVISDSVEWFEDANTASLESQRINANMLHAKILNSNFHLSTGGSTYGSLLDFLTALKKTIRIEKIQIITSQPQKHNSPPGAAKNRLITTYCLLYIISPSTQPPKKTYYFKFLYYSDPQQLKELATQNGFPNAETMDKNTSLIALEEKVTDNYPNDFTAMLPSDFEAITSKTLQGIQIMKYIELK